MVFLFDLNLIVGCSFRVDVKIQSLITERGFIDGLFGSWRYSETRLGGLQFLPLSANNPFNGTRPAKKLRLGLSGREPAYFSGSHDNQ
jgi:hypothetical protein